MSQLVPKVLTALPYVDRAPDPEERPDQRRIEWIRNGDCLGAAEHANDNKGELNRGPVQVQRNASTLYDNEQVLNESLKEVIERVNAHDTTLGDIGDENLATQVRDLEATVAPMEADIIANKLGIFLAGEDIKKIKTTIGTRTDEDPTERDIMADLLFVKKEMGNYAGKDINGNDTLELNEPSGMKARIVNNGLTIQSNTRRIAQLEADWVTSDVGALQANLDQMRVEIGRTADAPLKNIYGWIQDTDEHQAAQDVSIEELQIAVGIGSGSTNTLDERITANTSAISNNKNDIAQIDSRTVTLEQKVGDMGTPQGIEYRLADTERKVTEMNIILGPDENSGMREQVQDLMNEVGSDDIANSIKGRLFDNEAELHNSQRAIATLQTQVGDNTPGEETGIFKRLQNVELVIDGDGTELGLSDQILALTVAVDGKVEEAADDGKSYARNGKKWVEVVTDSIEEAPMDDGSYLRMNGQWTGLFSPDLTIPAAKKIVFGEQGQLVDAVAASVDALTFGDATKQTVLAGEVQSIAVAPAFTITSGAVPTNKLRVGNGTVELGDVGVRTIINSSTGFAPQVTTGGGFYDVLHEGNFPDNASDVPMVRADNTWKPLREYVSSVRSRGGVFVVNDTSTLALPADEAVAVASNVSPELFAWSVDFDLDTDGFKYTGKDMKVFQLIVQAECTTPTEDAEIEFSLDLNGQATGIKYVIKGNLWNTDKSAYAFINFPMTLNQGDAVKIYAKSKGKAAELNVVGSTMYATEM